jgi:anti-sigma regulatory factor (Ser/Thr protein kinase)
MGVVELEVPARTDYLALVRLVIAAAVALEPEIDEATLDDLRLAVTEAAANAIDAHKAATTDAPILIRCTSTADRVDIEIRDEGAGFDLDDVGELPPASDPRRLRHERGLGISLMRMLTDDVEFRSSPDGTAVRLTVFRRPA